jgi:hypothetical protein
MAPQKIQLFNHTNQNKHILLHERNSSFGVVFAVTSDN